MIFDYGDRTFRLTKLSARAQFLLLARLSPLLPALEGVGRSVDVRGRMTMTAAVEAVAPLARAGEDDLDFVLDACIATCDVLDGEDWRPAAAIADELDLAESMQIVAQVVGFNFAPFFAMQRPDFIRQVRGASFPPVSMPADLDWLFRPTLRGLCRYESIIDGTLHLEHIAEMNSLLDVSDENQMRAQAAAEREAARK